MSGSLEAYWTFDEVVGGVFRDSCGNGLDGTPIGGAGRPRESTAWQCALDGEDDYVNLGHPVELRLMGSMTLSDWVNFLFVPGR